MCVVIEDMEGDFVYSVEKAFLQTLLKNVFYFLVLFCLEWQMEL